MLSLYISLCLLLPFSSLTALAIPAKDYDDLHLILRCLPKPKPYLNDVESGLYEFLTTKTPDFVRALLCVASIFCTAEPFSLTLVDYLSGALMGMRRLGVPLICQHI